MATKSIRILVRFDWPTGAVSRLWDGSGPFVDGDGQTWVGCALGDSLDEIEGAINGESAMLQMTLTGVGEAAGDLVWLSYTTDQIIDGVVQVLIQPCDELDQPIGDSEVVFTGRVDNKIFDDQADGQRLRSTMTLEVVNRFTLRRLKSDRVLSDVDQRARSAAVNSTADPDRFCERVSTIEDKTITWPRFKS